MEAIAITVQGGLISSIEKVTNAPKEGFLIIDLDNITNANDDEKDDEVHASVSNFYEVDGEIYYENLVKELNQEVKRQKNMITLK